MKPGAGATAEVNRLFLEYARLDRKRKGEGLTVEELERWTGLNSRLNRYLSPGLSERLAGRRRSVRVPTRLDCSFESFGTFEAALITNLSSGGLFIATRCPLPIGSELRLRIRIDHTDAEVEIQGVVVSHNIGPASATDSSGMGVRFDQHAPETAKAINELYHQAIETACRREGESHRPESEPRRARR